MLSGLVQLGIGGSVMQYRKYFNSKEFKENPKVQELQEVAYYSIFHLLLLILSHKFVQRLTRRHLGSRSTRRAILIWAMACTATCYPMTNG
ncbi:hypothetical protein EON65_10150 [archaeon]|nr:MAG: hypothetical protein EON65_10150 [archaeon]